tara:strand:- start:475 stop:2250 length:1776 start_codon:yes stop_codon:yes gene_type:complete
MASDGNLIKASFSESTSKSKSNVIDKSNLYQSSVDISKGYANVINNTMKIYNDKKHKQTLSKEKQLNIFIKKAESSLDMLYSQELPMPDVFINAVEEEIKRLQDSFEEVNTLGKGDTQENKRKRRVIMGQLTRVTQGVIKTRAGFQTFGVNAKDINMETANGDLLDPAGVIIDLKNWGNNTNGDLEITFDENGTPEYTVSNFGDGSKDAVTLTMEDLSELYKPKDTTWDVEYMETLTTTEGNATEAAIKGDYDYDFKTERANFLSKIPDEKVFENVVSRRTEGVGEPSLREALRADLSVPISILNNMFVDDDNNLVDVSNVFRALDRDGNGFVDQQDMSFGDAMSKEDFEAFEKNYDYMIDVLTVASHDAFSLERSKELLADYYVGRGATTNDDGFFGIQQQQYDDSYQKQMKIQNRQNKANRTEDTDPQVFLKQGLYVRQSMVDSTLSDFNDGNVTMVSYNPDGKHWVPDGLGNYSNGSGADAVVLTKNQLMVSNEFALSNYLSATDTDYNKNKVRMQEDYIGENTAEDYAALLTRTYGATNISGSGNIVTVDLGNTVGEFDLSKKEDMDALMKFVKNNNKKYNIYQKAE